MFCLTFCDIIYSVNNIKEYVNIGDYDHNAHSVFRLYYHRILVVKYRRKVIDESISERAKEIFEYICPKYGISLEEWNHDQDHVHIMFRAQPKSKLSKFINAIRVPVVDC